VDGSTGAVDGPAVRAAATVAMQCEKHGTATGPGAALAGRVEVADIGITPLATQVFMAERADVAAALPRRALNAHKRSGGAVAMLAGSAGMAGAAVLCARGAVRMGAGYATVGATAAVARSVAGLVPEVLTSRLTDEEILGPDALGAFGPVLERAASVAIGPGLGRGDEQRALVHKALASVDLPVVLDADGLNALTGDTGPSRGALRANGRDAPSGRDEPAARDRGRGRPT
jgi:NAD(P)H-hydrate epimerase